jgi:hypothetical protein
MESNTSVRDSEVVELAAAVVGDAGDLTGGSRRKRFSSALVRLRASKIM